MNFTVRDKLLLWGYVTLVEGASPYKTHKRGRRVNFLVCTPAGHDALYEEMKREQARRT